LNFELILIIKHLRSFSSALPAADKELKGDDNKSGLDKIGHRWILLVGLIIVIVIVLACGAWLYRERKGSGDMISSMKFETLEAHCVRGWTSPC
jgi:hypothetical protein